MNNYFKYFLLIYTFLFSLRLDAAAAAAAEPSDSDAVKCSRFICPQQGSTNLCFLLPSIAFQKCISREDNAYTKVGSPTAFYKGVKGWQLAMRRLLETKGPFSEKFNSWLKSGLTSTDLLDDLGKKDDGDMGLESEIQKGFMPVVLYNMKGGTDGKDSSRHWRGYNQDIPTPFVFNQSTRKYKKIKLDGTLSDPYEIEDVAEELGLKELGWDGVDLLKSGGYRIYFYHENFKGDLEGNLRVKVNLLPKVLREDYAFYGVGFYILTLFAHGLDGDGTDISKTPAYKEFTEEMAKEEENPWHPSRLDKDMFFEYKLAQAIEELDKDEKEALYVYLDTIIPNMSLYDLADKKIKENGGDGIGSILSREYMAAYALSQKLRTLYLTAVNSEWYYQVYEISGETRAYMEEEEYGTPRHWIETFFPEKGSAKGQSIPFSHIWHKIRENLKFGKDHIITSFSGHGVVLIFNPSEEFDFVGKDKMGDPRVYKELGFTMVDSLYDQPFKRDFHPFYMTPKDEPAKT